MTIYCECLCLYYWAPIEMKDRLYDDLQTVISSTSLDDLLLVVGDFNAIVGCGDDMDPSWLGVRGSYV